MVGEARVPDDPVVASVVERVLGGYAACGPVGFAYGQGSTFTGFETDADLDLVLVWPDVIPPGVERPAHQLCDDGVEPVQYEGQDFGLDNLVVDGRDVQVFNYRRPAFDSWCRLVSDGEGWNGPGWPSPLYALAGFVYGVPIDDARGEAAAIRDRIASPTAKLRDNTSATVAGAFPEFRNALASSARRGEGWLFHQLTVRFVRQAYVAWFAAEGFYLPFPKHLDRWIERFALDRQVAGCERRIWELPGLAQRQHAVIEFAERVLSIRPQ